MPGATQPSTASGSVQRCGGPLVERQPAERRRSPVIGMPTPGTRQQLSDIRSAASSGSAQQPRLVGQPEGLGQVQRAPRRLQAADHREARPGGRSARPGRRCRSCSSRSARRRCAGTAAPVGASTRRYAVDVAGVERRPAPRPRPGRSRRRCRAARRSGDAVALDQLRVVEVVAGVEPDARRAARRAAPISCSASSSETFTPSTLSACVADELEERFGRRRRRRPSPSSRPAAGRTSRRASAGSPAAAPAEQLAVDRLVVLRRRARRGPAARLAIRITAAPAPRRLPAAPGSASMTRRASAVGAVRGRCPRPQAIRPPARGPPPALRRISSRGGRPVEAHAALGGVHGLGDAQAVATTVARGRRGWRPSRGGGRAGRVVGQRVGDDVGGGVGDPTAEAGAASSARHARRAGERVRRASGPSRVGQRRSRSAA